MKPTRSEGGVKPKTWAQTKRYVQAFVERSIREEIANAIHCRHYWATNGNAGMARRWRRVEENYVDALSILRKAAKR